MTLRTQSSFSVRAQDREVVLSTMRDVLAYLRRHHPDVSSRCFIDEQGDVVRFHLYQDAETDAHLAALQETTAQDPAFLALGGAVSSLILEAESQPYPSLELDG